MSIKSPTVVEKLRAIRCHKTGVGDIRCRSCQSRKRPLFTKSCKACMDAKQRVLSIIEWLGYPPPPKTGE